MSVSPARLVAVLPALVVLLLARLWLAPAGVRMAPATSTASEERAAACGVHGCGCPHEEVEASCCCAPEAPSEGLPRAVGARRATPDRGPVLAGAPSPAPRGPVLVGFHCSGGRGDAPPSRARAAPALLELTEARVVREAGIWIVEDGAAPPAGLRNEPEPRPPRIRRA